jgi:Zn-dependent metalloprotease
MELIINTSWKQKGNAQNNNSPLEEKKIKLQRQNKLRLHGTIKLDYRKQKIATWNEYLDYNLGKIYNAEEIVESTHETKL